MDLPLPTLSSGQEPGSSRMESEEGGSGHVGDDLRQRSSTGRGPWGLQCRGTSGAFPPASTLLCHRPPSPAHRGRRTPTEAVSSLSCERGRAGWAGAGP